LYRRHGHEKKREKGERKGGETSASRGVCASFPLKKGKGKKKGERKKHLTKALRRPLQLSEEGKKKKE